MVKISPWMCFETTFGGTSRARRQLRVYAFDFDVTVRLRAGGARARAQKKLNLKKKSELFKTHSPTLQTDRFHTTKVYHDTGVPPIRGSDFQFPPDPSKGKFFISAAGDNF